VIKKGEREIKNTKVYTGLPFLKGYVQSFSNKQRIPLKRSPRSVQYNTITLAPRKSTLYPATHNLLHPIAAVKQCTTQITNGRNDDNPKMEKMFKMERSEKRDRVTTIVY